MPVTVRLGTLDGQWETCGVDRVANVVPESLDLSSDDWGSKTCTFDLKRDPGQVWPDISAFSPVRIEIDGQDVWSGRVAETPARGRVMSVSCEGWQHHLDDDLYERVYVHNRLADWQDTRTFLSAPLGNYNAGATVQQTGNTIMLGWPTGFTTVAGTSTVGVTLDFGRSNSYPTSGSLTVAASTFAAGSFTIYLKGHDDLATIVSAGSNACSQDAATVGAMNGNASRAYRYWSIIIYKHSGGSFTETTDRVLRVSNALVVSDNAYRSGNASALTASTVVADAIRYAPKLSTDTTGISSTTFSIPELAPGDPQTPRELIGTVNGWHNWTRKVDAGKRMVFAAQPSRPKYVAGPGVVPEDSSQNSGRDIYNRVLVTGTDPAGQPVQAWRMAAPGLAPVFSNYLCPQPVNGTFGTDVSNWSLWPANTGTFVRTTTAGEFDSSPAGMKISHASNYPIVIGLLNGGLQGGRTYRLRCWLKAPTGGGSPLYRVTLTDGKTLGAGEIVGNTTGTFTADITVPYDWPTAYVYFTVYNGTAPVSGCIDSITLERQVGSLPDRRRFTRTKQLQVGATLPSDGVAAAAIGDLWLQTHASTPFRGTVTFTGQDSLRDRLTGQPVPLQQLLADTGEIIHFPDRGNPDTGAVGRDGRITAVQYNPATDTATVTLDNNRADFDALMSRLAVAGSQVT